jgi:HAD superfamily hydrolase (TIGR01549 family)
VAAFIFDLDGTLVDTVYQHVLAWHSALSECGYDLPMWRIHRKIGMSGALLMNALETEIGAAVPPERAKRMEAMHTEEMKKMRATVRLFTGSQELLKTLELNGVRFAIATSGNMRDVGPFLELLQLKDDVPIVSQQDAKNAKPDPQLFLSAAKKLGAKSEETIVVGDSVWDMLAARRAHFLGVGLLTGGYAESEMTAAGAYRVYADPAELRVHLHETGVRIEEK